jgi:DNA-binding beta-propeller fold protein YncE
MHTSTFARSYRTALGTLAAAALALVVGGITAPGAGADTSGDALVYVGSGSTITAVSPDTGLVRFTRPEAVATRDWSRIYTTEQSKDHRVLVTSDAHTGARLASRRVPRAVAVRAVSDDGRAVVLSHGATTGVNPYVPHPRSTTNLTVVRQGEATRTYQVAGNVEPEAFSLSKRSLFVIEYTPPTAPTRYRVARLDLTSRAATLRARAVRSNEDELQEPMRGTARAQALAPDGRRLYTLYTRDATATEPAEAFVHVLDLERERATCVDLPAEFATSSVGAVAVSPSGTRLYVVAPAAAALAEIDTASLQLTRTGRLVAPSTETTVRATATDAASLYVAVAGTVTRVDLGDLRPAAAFPVTGTVTGIQQAPDGGALLVSLTDRLILVDPRTGAWTRELATLSVGRIDHVAPALAPIAHEADHIQCAC